MARRLQMTGQVQQLTKPQTIAPRTEATMEYAMTRETLKTENQVFWGTGGRSELGA